MTATTPEQIDTLAERMAAYAARQDHPRARVLAETIAANWRRLQTARPAAPTLNLDDTDSEPRQHWQDGATHRSHAPHAHAPRKAKR